MLIFCGLTIGLTFFMMVIFALTRDMNKTKSYIPHKKDDDVLEEDADDRAPAKKVQKSAESLEREAEWERFEALLEDDLDENGPFLQNA